MRKLLFGRREQTPLPVLAPPLGELNVAAPNAARALSTCCAGTRATIVAVHCGDTEACRLRALGLCEGSSVDVLRSRDCTLLEVRGTRLAVGKTIASGIMVQPIA